MNKTEIFSLRKEFIKNFNNNDFFNACNIAEKIIKLYDKNDETYEYCVDLYNLAFIQQKLEKYGLCIKLYKKIIKILDKKEYDLENENDVKKIDLIIEIENSLGICYSKNYTTKLSFSINCFEKSLNLTKKYFKNDLDKLVRIIHNIGCAYYDIGQYEDAIYYHLEELSLRKEKNLDFVDNLNFLGYDYEKLGDFNTAINYFSQSLDVLKCIEGINSEEYIANLYYLSSIYYNIKDYEQAVKNYEQAYKIIEQKLGDKHPYLAEPLTKLSDSYIKVNKINNALKVQIKSLNIIKKTVGEKHIYYASNLRRVGDIYYILEDYEKALYYYENENNIKKEVVGIYNDEYVNSILNLINTYIKLGDIQKSKVLSEEIFKMIDFDLPKKSYKKSLLVLSKIYIYNDLNEYLSNIYEYFKNVDMLSSFEDMLSKAKNIEENILNKKEKLNNNFNSYNCNEENIEEDIFNGIKSLFDGIKKEIDRLDNENNSED